MERMIKRLFSFDKIVDRKEYWETVLILFLSFVLMYAINYSYDELKEINGLNYLMWVVFIALAGSNFVVIPFCLLNGRVKKLGRNQIIPKVLHFCTLFFVVDNFYLFLVLFTALLFTYGFLSVKKVDFY